MRQEYGQAQQQTLAPLLVKYAWATGLCFALISVQMVLSTPSMWTSGTLRLIVALPLNHLGWASVFGVVPVLGAAALLLGRMGRPAATSMARAQAAAAAAIFTFWLFGFLWAAALGSLTGPTAVGTFSLLAAIHWYVAMTNGEG